MNKRPNAADFFPQSITTTHDDSTEASELSYDSYNSLIEYLNDPNEIRSNVSSIKYNDTDSDISTINLSDADPSLTVSEDDCITNGTAEHTTCSNNSISSLPSKKSINSSDTATTDRSLPNRDVLPKSFLQLKGISIGNFNMGCNFRIDMAITIMIYYKLHMLAIQEHTPWNRELTPGEINSIKRHCDIWGYTVTISPLQILIIDKQLIACHRETSCHEEGRVIKCRLEIARDQYATFVPVYGVAHSGGEKYHTGSRDITNEGTTLEKMDKVQTKIKGIIKEAKRNKDLLYVFGDLQDTPDSSKTFHLGSCRIPKHPLGIVNACEAANLQCSIYRHMNALEKPIISRTGSKGGRFIDGMYACKQGLQKITGISIVHDSGINSDHRLVINKIDLGMEEFQISKDKEERIDFRSIMNIPVHLKPGYDHPCLNDTCFKGTDFRMQADLYKELQNIANDPSKGYLATMTNIKSQLERLETAIISTTKETISPEEQIAGKLIPRTPQDAAELMSASSQFFEVINNICRDANLAKKVYVLPKSAISSQKRAVAKEKTMPGISSLAVTKKLDDTIKRSRRIRQRIAILLKEIHRMQHLLRSTKPNEKLIKKTEKRTRINVRRLLKHREALSNSITDTIATCTSVSDERKHHIHAIESARNKQIFDADNKYVDSIIASPEFNEHHQFIHGMKKDILGVQNVKPFEQEMAARIPRTNKLQSLREKWDEAINHSNFDPCPPISAKTIKVWYHKAKKAKKLISLILNTANQIRQKEWKNSKTHAIRIGKYGTIARMTNPKPRSGPTANNAYPTIAGQPGMPAVSDHERKEASLKTHEMWMSNPPGTKNCHFLDITADDIGPNGITINPEKQFDADAAARYLKGTLTDMVCEDIVQRIKVAHEKLPELFRRVDTETKLTYPFKYDCISGEYLGYDLEKQLRKNICQGNGKARATGFAIPVLGRLPKIFIDVYLLKCKIQLAL